MTEKIIVAVDGGPASDSALAWALDRAKSSDVALEITSVVEIVPTAGAPVDNRQAYQDAVDSAVDRAQSAAPGLAITSTLRTGNPAHALIAASRRADLLVIGSNRTGALTGIVHGTLPLRVAGRSECPTVVVPAGWKPGGRGVVVGWDDDGTADVAVEFAAKEAARGHHELTILHAWRLPPSVGFADATPQWLSTDIESGARGALTAVASETRRSHPDVIVVEQLQLGAASGAIVGASRDAALVVVGSHGRRALGGLIIGSVSHDVLMNMPAPVVVVPHPDEPIQVLPEILDEDVI